MRDFIKRHQAACFIALAFGWAWAWWLPVAGTDMSDLAKVSPVFFICAMTGGFGPTIAGLVVRFCLPKGERNKLLRKPHPGLFLLALAVVPLATLASLAINRWLGLPSDPSDIVSRLAIGLVWPLMASLGEEFGWRGLLLPLWSRKGSFWKPALAIGLIWGLWHLPSDWIGLRHLGWYFIPQYLLVGLVNLTLLSVIMTAIVKRGNGDIRLAILFHYSITSSAILFGVQGQTAPLATVAATAVSQAVLQLFGALM